MKTKLFFFAVCGLSSSLVQGAVYAHYSFDADYTDSSGNGNHGTFTDNGVTGNSGIINTSGGYKFGGGAMEFSNENDYVSIPSVTFSSSSTIEPYTVSFWAQVDDASREWNMVLGERESKNFFIALNGDDDTLSWRSASNTSSRTASFDTGVNDTDWHHYVVTADASGNVSTYLDGSLVSTATGKTPGFIVDTIGNAYNSSYGFDFQGRIDEVWILDEAVDASVVTSLYTINAVPEPSASFLLGLGGFALIFRRNK